MNAYDADTDEMVRLLDQLATMHAALSDPTLTIDQYTRDIGNHVLGRQLNRCKRKGCGPAALAILRVGIAE